ncbi:hypothetical protein BaRGS_00008714 [Batillaria attramentaria]|uniref:Uncharacterized protein n=1 Tax=Batillaria attramentaria TaxID=370345 RepID=A0ABD0LLF9_9CAEN
MASFATNDLNNTHPASHIFQWLFLGQIHLWRSHAVLSVFLNPPSRAGDYKVVVAGAAAVAAIVSGRWSRTAVRTTTLGQASASTKCACSVHCTDDRVVCSSSSVVCVRPHADCSAQGDRCGQAG